MSSPEKKAEKLQAKVNRVRSRIKPGDIHRDHWVPWSKREKEDPAPEEMTPEDKVKIERMIQDAYDNPGELITEDLSE